MEARFKAISEAVERWAHMSVLTSGEPHRFGFGTDPSSNGMAAFPGLWKRQARPAAQMEATERFNLLSWWEGRLPIREIQTPWPGIRGLAIESEAPGIAVLLHKRCSSGHYAYGHAAGADIEAGCRRAVIELERHEYVVKRYLLAHAGASRGELPATAHPIERRSLFFALPEGHEIFQEHVRAVPRQHQPKPRLVFDGPVTGPWSRYADVWRVVYEPPSARFLGNDEHYFFW
jgi:ribosomal protein S12 methylthiotransferase accessory factor YcaO